tara:strand:- start:3858 stop:5882 length:2025 start_codon:yes stop_codon:yes gene_type:complete
MSKLYNDNTSGLYSGDGGVSFAEEKFAFARDRRDREARKAEKFSKNLQKLNFAVAGANMMLNNKADKLETDGLLERAHYLDANDSAKNWTTMYKEYEKEGLTKEQMLFEETRKNLNGYLQRQFGEEYDISGFSDTVNNLSREWSSNKDNLASWNKALDAQLAIPGLSNEELIPLLQAEVKAPRSVGAFFGNSLLKIAKSHDEDTLKEEDSIAKQKVLGGLLGEKFSTSKAALEEYAALGNPIEELAEFIKSEAGKEIPVFKNAQQVIVPDTKTDRFGNVVDVKYMITTAVGQGGQPIQIGNPIIVGKNTVESRIKEFKEADYKVADSQIKDIVASSTDAELEEAYEIYKKNPLGLAANVLKTKQNLMRSMPDIGESQAMGAATKFILSQNPDDIIDDTMSLYDFEKIITGGQIDTERLPLYIESINKTSSNVSKTRELTSMRDEILGSIKLSKLKDNEKEAEINSLNSLFQEYIPPAKEYNEEILNELPNGETKSFLQVINEVPYVGAISKGMFDDELDFYDASWLIPGGFLLKFAGRTKTAKSLIPKVAQTVLQNKGTQASIAKISARVQKGFKSPAMQERYLKTLGPIEKVIFQTFRRKGNMNKFNRKFNEELFMDNLIKMPGVYFKAYKPSLKQIIQYGLGGTIFGFMQYSRPKGDFTKAPETPPVVEPSE